jgi:hypothetical protein
MNHAPEVFHKVLEKVRCMAIARPGTEKIKWMTMTENELIFLKIYCQLLIEFCAAAIAIPAQI